MKIKDLIAELQKVDPELDVKMEFNYKTGYDEGDTYHMDPKKVRVSTLGYVVIEPGAWRLAGGW